MDILLLGRSGQVGWELQRSLSLLGHVTALNHAQLDLVDATAVRGCIRSRRWDWIVNAAAYTAVDQAEHDVELARQINGIAPTLIAEEATGLGARMIHFSTDYVFNGASSRPYTESDATDPLNAYGRSKLLGEEGVLAAGGEHFVLRTSWVFSARGRNFLRSVLRKIEAREELRIVDDQHGSPTWARHLGLAVSHVIYRASYATGVPAGLYHVSSKGDTTWYGFASAVIDAMRDLQSDKVCMVPIKSADLSVATRRPRYSVMDNTRFSEVFAVELPPWELAVNLCLDEFGLR